MASQIRQIVQCLTSPRLFRTYGDHSNEAFWNYEPRVLERWGDIVIKSFWVLLNLKYISLPVIGIMMYRKCYVALTGIGLLLAASYGLRAAGRSTNEAYVSFLRTLTAAQKDLNRDTKRALMKYDFEFDAWPCEFQLKDISEGDRSKYRTKVQQSSVQRIESFGERLLSMPCRTIGYTVANTVGYKLMFPGSIQVLQFFIDGAIIQGRSKLVVEEKAERFKLHTEDGNYIDSMFVDRRKKGGNGDILVICCEGNAGFYEIGIMATPLGNNYSVFGWNYPGFGWSTGTPYPDAVTNGVDTVVQFAIHKLHFQPENILLFAWSIGGYAVSWASMNYPDVKGVVLDASFDDVLPLALSRFPMSWEPLVHRIIREYMNLNNIEQLTKYPGPVLLYRRTEDEIIAIDPEVLATNRGNHLLVQLLKYRYPQIIQGKAQEELLAWLTVKPNKQGALWNRLNVDEDLCTTTLISYVSEHSNSYPMMIGEDFDDALRTQIALFLCHKYLVDYNSTHCTPLPSSLFRLPWDISPESDFVKL